MITQKDIIESLEKNGTPYQLVEHTAVFTIEEMDALKLGDKGDIIKNLFLRDAKGKRHFLILLHGEKSADLKLLKEKLGTSNLSFASEERLYKHLGLTKGAVTPFGVLNNGNGSVEVIVDEDLRGNPCIGVHPNTNTATLFMAFNDIERVIRNHGNSLTFVKLSE